MHSLIWTICVAFFIAGITLLIIEASKPIDKRENIYIYLALSFTFLAFILMMIYIIIFYVEESKYS